MLPSRRSTFPVVALLSLAAAACARSNAPTTPVAEPVATAGTPPRCAEPDATDGAPIVRLSATGIRVGETPLAVDAKKLGEPREHFIDPLYRALKAHGAGDESEPGEARAVVFAVDETTTGALLTSAIATADLAGYAEVELCDAHGAVAFSHRREHVAGADLLLELTSAGGPVSIKVMQPDREPQQSARAAEAELSSLAAKLDATSREACSSQRRCFTQVHLVLAADIPASAALRVLRVVRRADTLRDARTSVRLDRPWSGFGAIQSADEMSGPPGALPPGVIQHTIRENFPRARACYEEGLRRKPQLAGKVSVHFVIGRDGSVMRASEYAGLASTLARPTGSVEAEYLELHPEPPYEDRLDDATVRACVVGVFRTLRFPTPGNGTVTVVYPILFSPGD
jgi:hypothetical protein